MEYEEIAVRKNEAYINIHKTCRIVDMGNELKKLNSQSGTKKFNRKQTTKEIN